MPGTVQAWYEALTHNRIWDEHRDTQRLREAFATLASTSAHWPAPKHLLNAMPATVQRALNYELKPASRAVVKAALAEATSLLRIPAHATSRPTWPPRQPDLEQTERALVKHYQAGQHLCEEDP